MMDRREIAATGPVPAEREAVFDFLADLENHWVLADRFIEVVSLERAADGRSEGGRVRMRGPLGVRRTASTDVLAADPPERMVGEAQLSHGTTAFVRWKLSGAPSGTHVRLEATIDRTGWLDRLLLLLGGRAWLERRFAAVLGRLAEQLPADSERTPPHSASPEEVASDASVRGASA